MGTKSSKTTPAPPTAQELELQGLSVEEKKLQIDALKKQAEFQKFLTDFALPELQASAKERAALNAAISPEDRATFAKQEFERSQRLGPIQDELLQRQLEDIRRGGAATPEQIQRIDEFTKAGFAAGSEDIDNATREGLKLLREELAPSLGLRPTDSPILDRGGTLAREGVRQKSSLGLNLQTSGAAAKLNFPLAASQLFSAQNQSQQGLNENIRNFQQQLQQQAFQNRLALSGQATGGGLGLAGIGGGAAGFSASRGSTTNNSGLGIGEFGQLAAGAGALIGASDRRLKKDIAKIGVLPNGIPIYTFRYKGNFNELYQGVMADDVEKIIPNAVIIGHHGFKKVDYSLLGERRA